MRILQFLAVGMAAGWIMGRITRGRGFGWVGNLVIGAAGSLIGGFVAGFFRWPLASGGGSALIASLAGAAILFFALSFLRPGPRPKVES